MKTKTAQISVQMLNNYAIHPDFLIARSEVGLDNERIQKLSKYCFLPKSHIISAPDIDCIYDIPINFEQANIGEEILKSLSLRSEKTSLFSDWKKKVSKIKNPKKKLDIAIVGKYHRSGDFDIKDSYVSLTEAIDHACSDFSTEANIHWVDVEELKKRGNTEKFLNMDGIILPQGWGNNNKEEKLKAVQLARENKIPFLGLGDGMHFAIKEYARNILKLDSKSLDNIISDKKDNKARIGAYACKLEKNSLVYKTYKKYGNGLYKSLPTVYERHKHKYIFNNEYKKYFKDSSLKFTAQNPKEKIKEAIELEQKEHPFFIATQYLPELKSRFLEPHPLFMGFVEACLKNK